MAAQALTPTERETLIMDLKSNYTVASLAESYNVSKQAIYYMYNKYVLKKTPKRSKPKKKGRRQH